MYFNLSFADELDELLQDDLYDVALSFEDNENKEDETQHKWWILKAALADKGNGIRLFSTREQLEAIFDEFEQSSSEEEEEDEEDEEGTNGRSLGYSSDTRVNASQMREWVIQVSPRQLRTAHAPFRHPQLTSPPLRRNTSHPRSCSTRHPTTERGSSSTCECTCSPLGA